MACKGSGVRVPLAPPRRNRTRTAPSGRFPTTAVADLDHGDEVLQPTKSWALRVYALRVTTQVSTRGDGVDHLGVAVPKVPLRLAGSG